MNQQDQDRLNQERRRHPRLTGSIPVKISSGDFDLVTETKNLSRTGAYCRVNKYIEPMTKLRLQLLLPVKKGEKSVTKKISCNGVIVRTESIPGEDAFNVAIYFNEITNRGAETISDYINHTLEASEPVI